MSYWRPAERSMTFNQLVRALDRRPSLTCSGCGYTWQPRGKDYSLKCPNCKAALRIPRTSSCAGCLGVAAVLVVGYLFLRSGGSSSSLGPVQKQWNPSPAERGHRSD
jgi:predicted RNA-binding Zn-ribbon protein involved in translation (DUF1610 family)